MKIKTDYLITDKDRLGVLSPGPFTPTEITFHNTYNDASASAEVRNVRNNSTGTSFHTAVDDKEVQQVIPFTWAAWHAGDGGSGAGNRKSIGVEICYSMSGGPRYRASELNAIDHISDLMVQFNIPISKVKTHQERSGKYCPHRMLDEGRVGWFKNECDKAYNKKKGGGAIVVQPGTAQFQTGGFGFDKAVEVLNDMQKCGVTGRLQVQLDGTFFVVTDRLPEKTIWKLDNVFATKGWWFQYI